MKKVILLVLTLFLVGCDNKTVDNNYQNVAVYGNVSSIVSDRTFMNNEIELPGMIPSIYAKSSFEYWFYGELIFDEKGRVVDYKSGDESLATYSYNDQGQLRSEMLYSRNKPFKEYSYAYGEENKYEIIDHNIEKVVSTGTFEMNKKGLLKFKEDENFLGGITRYEYEYEDQNVTHLTMETSSFGYEYQLAYDVFPIEMIYTVSSKNDDKVYNFTYDYEVDDKGNWTKCNTYMDGTLIQTVERTITYR